MRKAWYHDDSNNNDNVVMKQEVVCKKVIWNRGSMALCSVKAAHCWKRLPPPSEKKEKWKKITFTTISGLRKSGVCTFYDCVYLSKSTRRLVCGRPVETYHTGALLCGYAPMWYLRLADYTPVEDVLAFISHHNRKFSSFLADNTWQKRKIVSILQQLICQIRSYGQINFEKAAGGRLHV